MSRPTEQEIRAHAYSIWEGMGCPQGKENECWALAEQQLRNEDEENPTRTPDTL